MKLVRTIINQAPRDWRAGGVFVRTLLAERIRPHRTHRASERERGRQENFFECVLRYRRPRNRKIDRASPASFDGDGVRLDRKEAAPVQLPWTPGKRNLTGLGRLAKNPAVRKIVGTAENVLKDWIGAELKQTRAELDRSAENVAKLESALK